MTQRRELFEDLRAEHAVRALVIEQLDAGQPALDLAIGGLAEFLGLDADELPKAVLCNVSVTAEVRLPGQEESQQVNIELSVPEAPSAAPVISATPEPPSNAVALGSLAHSTTSRGIYGDLIRALGSIDVSQMAGIQAALRSMPRVDVPSNQTQQLAAAMQTLANARAHSSGGAAATVQQPLKDVLLELFSSDPDSWYTMQEVMAELESRGVEAEYEEVRKTIHGLHAIYPQLEKPTRKSWVWRSQSDDQDEHGDVDGADETEVMEDEGTPEEYMVGEVDAPTMSNYVRMDDFVSAPDHVDSDGLTTNIPLEADRD